MSSDTHFEPKSPAQYQYDRRNNAIQMRKQVIHFALMIFLTFVAFGLVVAGFSPYFTVPVILLLAGIQVMQQLYSFMHMWDKDGYHLGTINIFVWMGVVFAFTFFLCFLTIIWW